jgi:hypothetical protein
MLVRALLVHIAHETAGAARIRHSLRPLISRGRENNLQTSGAMRREMANPHPAVIAREGGRSSIPETLMIESRSRGVLDHPLSRVTTTLYVAALSTSLRGALATTCPPKLNERRRKQSILSLPHDGLLRFARNDGHCCLKFESLPHTTRHARAWPGDPRLTFARTTRTWMAGHRRAEPTPSFGRLCPAMTNKHGRYV